MLRIIDRSTKEERIFSIYDDRRKENLLQIISNKVYISVLLPPLAFNFFINLIILFTLILLYFMGWSGKNWKQPADTTILK